MNKKCSKCKKGKSTNQFAIKNKQQNTFQSHCKDCQKLISRKHYYKNRNYYIQKATKSKQDSIDRNRPKVFDYLMNHPCVDCGEDDPVVLQFDHVRGEKKKAVSMMLGKSWELIQKEIDKCEIRCSNCHARKTAKQLGYWHPNI